MIYRLNIDLKENSLKEKVTKIFFFFKKGIKVKLLRMFSEALTEAG